MNIRAVKGDATQIQADAIIVNLFEGVEKPGGATGAVDKALGGIISELIARGDMKGKLGETVIIPTFGKIPSFRVLIVGLGKREDFSKDTIRIASSEALKALRKRAKKVATILHGAGVGGLDPKTSAMAITEGAILGLYSYKEKEEDIELMILDRTGENLDMIEEGIKTGRIKAEAQNLVRDMVNEPSNLMTPRRLEEKAREVAEKRGLKIEVLDREDMERLGMGAILGVSRGSSEPPKFIVLKQGEGGTGIIGKGITFDSGGISLKSEEAMRNMKGDMAGAAVVIGVMDAISALNPDLNATGIIPACENLPGGSAIKPGDVLKTMSGKTIEVISTDAEGRMILADAISYAKKLNLSPIIDIATLTGACHIALGDICAGLFSNSDELSSLTIKASEEEGEKLWRMPLIEEYKEDLKSDIADIKNLGKRYGGAITAALFLKEFVEDTPWVHLDIAGPAFSDKEKFYIKKGGTGFGTRTIINLLTKIKEGRGE